MKYLRMAWARPLNFFQVHGTMCCDNMFREYQRLHFKDYRFCYEAKIIYEANALILWGSISKKLSDVILDQIEHLNNKRFVLHIRGCDQRIDNDYVTSSIASILPVSTIFSNCVLSQSDYQRLIVEARQCLQV